MLLQCHAHQKAKDAPKKRRDSSAHSRPAVKVKPIKDEIIIKEETLDQVKLEGYSSAQAPSKSVQALQTISALL